MRARLPPSLARWPRRLSLNAKLLSLLALMLVLSGALTLGQFRRDLGDYGQQQLQTLGQAAAFQTALNAAPLILAGDWLSLNITLKQLTDAPQIAGAEVYDRNGKQLAQAGHLSERVYEQTISLQDDTLGKVRIHLATAPLEQALDQALRATQLAALAGGLLTLLAVGLLGRHFAAALRELNRAATRIAEGEPIAPLDESRRDEFGAIHRQLNRRFAPAPEPLSAELEALARELGEPAPEAPTESDAPPSDAAEKPLALDEPIPTAPPERSDAGSAASATPCQPRRHYLLYVDHQGAASHSPPEERRELLELYRARLEQVGQLYNGRLEEDDRGNWYLDFPPLSDDQSHGINALCAAQLFNGLYRGLNQHRIRRFSPVANMKMALVTGDDTRSLLDQASALTAAIAANELITARPLFEVAPLHERLLAGGDYRNTDQPAYLLTRLSADYQELIDRQVEHFLKPQ